MKKYGLIVLVAIAVLSRLPHPARDISKLDPVQSLYISMEAGEYYMVTDTGDEGRGPDLPAAAEDMKASADREIYLETAEFLVLQEGTPITADFFTLLRPSARVHYTKEAPELTELTPYLENHPPEQKLNHLRGGAQS